MMKRSLHDSMLFKQGESKSGEVLMKWAGLVVVFPCYMCCLCRCPDQGGPTPAGCWP